MHLMECGNVDRLGHLPTLSITHGSAHESVNHFPHGDMNEIIKLVAPTVLNRCTKGSIPLRAAFHEELYVGTERAVSGSSVLVTNGLCTE